MNQFKHSVQSFFKRTEKYIMNHQKYIFATAINLTALFIISIALQFSGIFEIQRFIDFNLCVWTVITFDIIALSCYRQKTRGDTLLKNLIKDAFISLLLIQLISTTIFKEEFLLSNPIFLALTIILGIIIISTNRHTINEIEKESDQEQLEKQKRKKEFAEKYQWINRLRGLRWIMRWMYV